MENRLLKRECHQMMLIMWGDNTTRAYIWLKENVGYDVHFSEIKDRNKLLEIHHKLMDRMERKGFDRDLLSEAYYRHLDRLEPEDKW